MGALLVRQFRRFSRARSIAQRGFDAFFDTSLPGVVDHGGGHGQGFDNLRILTTCCRLQQYPGPSLLARCALALAQHGFQHFDFVICQRDTLLDGGHGGFLSGVVLSCMQRLCLLSVQIMVTGY